MPEWIVKYWVEWAFGLIAAGLGLVVKSLSGKVKREKEAREAETEALKSGMRALLRRQILNDCKRAAQEGYCQAEDRDTITAMFDAYTKLGGNGSVKDAYDEMRELPLNRRAS